jgi:hypothetical protein
MRAWKTLAALLFVVTLALPARATAMSEGEPFSTTHEWKYTTRVGEWVFSTFIDVGGSTHQLAYQQAIHSAGQQLLKEGISVLSWLGVGGGHTQWNQLTGADIDSAAASL